MEDALEDHVSAEANEEEAPIEPFDQSTSPSLASTRSIWFNLFFTLAILCSHACFLYGQIAVMWKLIFRLEVNLGLESIPGSLLDRTLKVFGLPDHYDLDTTLNNTIQTFTYMDAIQGLWEGGTRVPNPEWRGDTGPGATGKLAAVILILFSAIWPHVKLMSLHLTWYTTYLKENTRSAILYWLDYGGKWSMCDVMVICLMLAVLSVDIPITGEDLLVHLKADLLSWIHTINRNNPDGLLHIAQHLCSLRYTDKANVCSTSQCGGGTKNSFCQECICAVEFSFPSIDILLEFLERTAKDVKIKGSGIGVLRVIGEAGIYVFCAGVLISLLLSSYVDYVDHSVRGARIARMRTRSLLASRGHHGTSYRNLYQEQELAVVEPGRQMRFMTLPKRLRIGHYQGASSSRFLQVLSCVNLVICIIACYAGNLFDRYVPGSVSKILQEDFGIDLSRTYSLANLVTLTGKEGGWDKLLMAVFSLFVLIGPIGRATIECILATFPLPPRFQIRLAFAISLLGSFCGWDVLLVALVLVSAEMPHITGMIIPPLSPPCIALKSLGLGEFCLEIGLGIRLNYLLVVFAMLCLSLVSVRLVRAAFIVLDPFGDTEHRGGPPLPCNLEDKIFGQGRYEI